MTNKNVEVAVEIKGLNWKIGNAKILNEIDLDLDKNSFIGIIGPNGSGKTTLLRNISTWYKPHANTILLGDKDILSFTGRQLSQNMAYVTQNTIIEFEFTVLDIVLMGRAPYISRLANEDQKDIEKARRIMELTGIWDLKDRLVTGLSGGEFQKAMISRALVQETPILLMDEPISNLDINHQIQIMDLIKRYQQEKELTVVIVLHDLNMAAQYCKKLVLLKKGQIFCYGSPQEVLTRDNIKTVYGIDVHIMDSPLNGFPHIIPISSLSETKKEDG